MPRVPSGPGSSSGSEHPLSTSAPATARAVRVGTIREVLIPLGRDPADVRFRPRVRSAFAPDRRGDGLGTSGSNTHGMM